MPGPNLATRAHDTTTRGADADAIRLWQHLHGDRQDLLFLFSGFYKRKGTTGELTNPADQVFRPDQLEQAAAWAAQQDRNGREVYFSVAQLLAPRRVKENAAPSRVVHADLDGAPLEACPIRPTAVVESSPGRYHAYWRLARLLQPADIEQFNRRMALAIGADKAATDAIRLLRVPGTHNRKRAGASALVAVLYIDDEHTVDQGELERVLPALESPVAIQTSPALSTDDDELVALLSPDVRDLYSTGDTSIFGDDDSAADWALAQELLRATGGDVERTCTLMRSSSLERPKWSERRNGHDYLYYTVARARENPSQPLNDMAHRSDAQLPANGPCPNCAQYRRQIDLMGELIKADLSPVFKLTLLRLVAIVGFAQARGHATFSTTATRIAESVHLSSQTVRQVLHALARYDNQELVRDDGLLDLNVTRSHVGPSGSDCACPCHQADPGRRACPSCRNEDLILSAFNVTPLTEGGYAGFLEAVVGFVPELPTKPKRVRKPQPAAAELPPDVVAIADCPNHPMHSRTVVCAQCGDELVQETRYYVLNDMRHRSGPHRPAVDTYSDIRHRSAARNGHAGAAVRERWRMHEVRW